MDAIRPGDRVSWTSQLTDRRHFGTVVAVLTVDNQTKYRVRGDRRMPILLDPVRITKECN